ncbi:hypothetical protein WAK64_05895 [Bacillus spongiae]|uniref:Uncharacterized protein n=1 Tax=Bacillus spongiae TaxID=2683610 RepID=A0ABU8HBC8_9BACI
MTQPSRNKLLPLNDREYAKILGHSGMTEVTVNQVVEQIGDNERTHFLNTG